MHIEGSSKCRLGWLDRPLAFAGGGGGTGTEHYFLFGRASSCELRAEVLNSVRVDCCIGDIDPASVLEEHRAVAKLRERA